MRLWTSRPRYSRLGCFRSTRLRSRDSRLSDWLDAMRLRLRRGYCDGKFFLLSTDDFEDTDLFLWMLPMFAGFLESEIRISETLLFLKCLDERRTLPWWLWWFWAQIYELLVQVCLDGLKTSYNVTWSTDEDVNSRHSAQTLPFSWEMKYIGLWIFLRVYFRMVSQVNSWVKLLFRGLILCLRWSR